MIRSDRIQSEFLGDLGFRQPFDDTYAIVDSNNLASASGLYYQDASDYVTIQNIIDCQSYSEIDSIDFNTYLKRLQNDAALKVCQKVINKESDLIQDINLYPFEKSFDNTIEKTNSFVGIKIEPNTFNNTRILKIKWIELCLDSAVTDLPIYLYNSNKPETYIKSTTITTVANESVILNIDDWFCADNESNKGGYYYLGYFESDLGSAKAVKKDYELSDNLITTKYYYIIPVALSYSGTKIDVTSYTEKSDSYGLNLGISIYNDYTELILSNKSLFWQAIQYQLAERVLNIIKTSIRSNISERLNKENIEEINFELYGNRDAGIVGLTGKLTQEIDNLKKMLFYKPPMRQSTLKYGRTFNHKYRQPGL
jgi:hypothetical protein